MGGISFVNFHSKVSDFDFCYTAILCGLVGVFFLFLWEEGIKDNFTWTPHKRLSIQETDISTGRALTLKFLSKPTKIVHAATHSLLLRYDDEELEELVTWMTWLRNPSLDPATRRCLRGSGGRQIGKQRRDWMTIYRRRRRGRNLFIHNM